ncbi:hypothetical protein Tco_1107542 [Tanacetum coccineum]
MSSITAQQTKLDLELVPKEKRLDIRKCNGRLNTGKIEREPTFQVVLDALALTLCYYAFLINADGMYHQKNMDYVELLWEDFIYQIDNKAYKKQEKMYYPRFTKVIIHHFLTQDKTLSWRNKIGMQTSKDDYLINTLRFVSAKKETQIYGAILPDSLTNPEMKETKEYKTYFGFASGATPPKKSRKFKKTASPKLTIVPVSTEEPTRKSKRVKRPVKKMTKAPSRGVVIRETPEISVSKKKEKVDVTRVKGIELLSQVALTEDAQFEEVRKKSMRDFHKTHLSGSGTVTKTAPSAINIIPSVTSEGTGVKPGIPDVTEEELCESEAESWGNDEDDINNEQESSGEESDQKNDNNDDKTQSDNENESNSKHKTDENESGSKSDQDENEEDEDDEEEVKDELVKTPSNDSDNEDETKFTDKAEGDEDEEMIYTTSQLYNDVDIRLNEPVNSVKGFVQEEGTNAAMTNIQQGNENLQILQVIEDAHVTLSTVPQKTEVPVTSSSHSSDLAAKFLNFSDIPYTNAEIVSPMDVHVHHEVPSQQTPTLLTVPVSVISDSLQAAATLTEFELKKILIDKIDKSESYLAAPKHKECYEGLKKSYDLDKTIFSTYGKVFSLKRSQKDKDEDPSARSGRGLKKRKTSKDAAPTTEEPDFKVADSDMPQDQEENLGKNDEEPKEKVASKRDWLTKPIQPQEPTDPNWNADKTPQQGQNQSWLMTLASSADKSLMTFDELMSTPIDLYAFDILEECKKSKPKAYTSLNGPTRTHLMGQPRWQSCAFLLAIDTWKEDQGLIFDDLKNDFDQGSRFEDGGASQRPRRFTSSL